MGHFHVQPFPDTVQSDLQRVYFLNVCVLSNERNTQLCCLPSVCCNADVLIQAAGLDYKPGSDLIIVIETGVFYSTIYST